MANNLRPVASLDQRLIDPVWKAGPDERGERTGERGLAWNETAVLETEAGVAFQYIDQESLVVGMWYIALAINVSLPSVRGSASAFWALLFLAGTKRLSGMHKFHAFNNFQKFRDDFHGNYFQAKGKALTVHYSKCYVLRLCQNFFCVKHNIIKINNLRIFSNLVSFFMFSCKKGSNFRLLQVPLGKNLLEVHNYRPISWKQESVRTMVPKGIRTKCNI